jgi:hypothetical protein
MRVLTRKLVILCIILACLTLSIPVASNATPILLGQADLTVSWSNVIPNVPYYVEYNGTVTNSNFGYQISSAPIFCVSVDPAIGAPRPYDFYSIVDLGAALAEAAWIADQYLAGNATRVDAQLAIWAVVGVGDYTGNYANAHSLYLAALNQSGYTTSNWYYAHNPAGLDPAKYPNDGFQDYLTPTPEPATLLLMGFGSGIIGGGINRLRRRFKKA